MPGLTGADIYRYRLELGLSQRELAERLGLHVLTISRWERGIVVPAHPETIRLALESLHSEMNRRTGPGRPRKRRNTRHGPEDARS